MSEDSLFGRFPYLLPCIVVSLISLGGTIFGYFWLTESKPESYAIIELSNVSVDSRKFEDGNEDSKSHLLAPEFEHPEDEDEIETRTENGAEMEKEKEESIAEIDFDMSESSPPPPEPSIFANCRVFRHRDPLITVGIYILIGFIYTALDETFSIWAMNNISSGGLGMTESEIGICYMVNGIASLPWNFFVYPFLDRVFGTLSLMKVGLFLCIIPFCILPSLTYVFQISKAGGLASLITVLLIRSCSSSIIFTPIMLLINNSVAPSLLGFTNGCAQSGVALARALAPTFGGSILAFSLESHLSFPFNHFFVFLLLGSLLFVCGIAAQFLTPAVNFRKSETPLSHLNPE